MHASDGEKIREGMADPGFSLFDPFTTTYFHNASPENAKG
jgi:hypothetical protein